MVAVATPCCPRAGFGNHPRLAHAPRQHGLADGVVDLVCTGVVEVFALEVNLRAADLPAQPRSVVDGAGPADKVLELGAVFSQESRIVLYPCIGLLQFI